jgi:hypothetical protein
LRRPGSLLALLLALVAAPAAGAATPAPTDAVPLERTQPLALAWGVVAETDEPGATTPGRVAEHLEFLLAHDWRPVRVADLSGGEGAATAVLLTFDDPASALRLVLPLLELYQVPAAVTVDPRQAHDPALEPVLTALAASPWVELLPRVAGTEGPAPPATLTCGDPGVEPGRREEQTLSALRNTLALQLARLATLGETPHAVAWAPNTWSGPAEAVAASLGLALNLPTFSTVPPAVPAPRVARYEVPTWAGVWALAQAKVHWDPQHHPVRFVEVEAAWVCAGGDPAARVARILEVVRRLGLNGVRIHPGDGGGAWFPTAAAPVRGEVVGPLVDALHDAGVRWVVVDLPATTGDAGRDVTLAADLARGAALDVAILPPDSRPEQRLGEAVRFVRPTVRLAWRSLEPADGHAFVVEPFAASHSPERGLTVAATSVATADKTAVSRAVEGWQWLGLPFDLAERGLADSVRSLAAFALPGSPR